MSSSMKFGLAVVLSGVLTSGVASAARTDSWINATASIALLTTDGAGGNGAKADTDGGQVTLQGTVATEAEKAKAEETVKAVDGVTSVRNRLKVADRRPVAKVADADLKVAVDAALKLQKRFQDVTVPSVEAGVVVLEGKTITLNTKLLAIQTAYEVPGVQGVVVKITTDEI